MTENAKDKAAGHEKASGNLEEGLEESMAGSDPPSEVQPKHSGDKPLPSEAKKDSSEQPS